jgi:hypothetical protein
VFAAPQRDREEIDYLPGKLALADLSLCRRFVIAALNGGGFKLPDYETHPERLDTILWGRR